MFMKQQAIAVAIAMASLVAAETRAGCAVAAEVYPDLTVGRGIASRLAENSVVLSVARAGTRLIAVGERGHVLVSDDNGGKWTQVVVPTNVTLTLVRFSSPSVGWAVGHSGVVLKTVDGGLSWTASLDGIQAAKLTLAAAEASGNQSRVHSAQRLVEDGADKPFLAVATLDDKTVQVYGAFGLALETRDGGKTWAAIDGRLPNPRQLHINAATVSGQRIILAGEQGLLLVSDDGGETFSPRQQPYDGTLFSVVTGGQGDLIIAGLRGHIFRSLDDGRTWMPCGHPVDETVMDGLLLPDGRDVFGTVGGHLLVGGQDCASFSVLNVPSIGPLASLVADGGSGLVLGGMSGIARYSLQLHEKEGR